jgi:hypothetical protein
VIAGTLISNTAPEFVTHAVAPNKEYLVWVGAYDVDADGNPQVLPKTTDAGLCMNAYTIAAGTCAFTELVATDGGTDPAAGNNRINSADLSLLTVSGSTQTICGTFQNNLLDLDADTVVDVVDLDWFSISVPATLGNVLLRMRVTGVDLATHLPATTAAVADNNNTPTGTFGTGAQLDDDLFGDLGFGTMYSHVVFSAADFPEVAGGDPNVRNYRVSAQLLGDVATTGTVTYEIDIITDDRDQRCGPGIAPTYTERADGPSNTLNDVVEQTFGASGGSVLTVVETDTPEPTGITLDGQNYNFQGTMATGTDPADEYLDRDSYLVRTGANTNEITFRLDWPDADADIDFFFHRACRTADVGVDPDCPAP